jgi:DNA polymerase-3 subunit delta'
MLIGHQRIWDYLIKSSQNGRLAHAYLFVGPSEIGKKTLALEFVKWLLCEQKNKTPKSACNECKNCLDIVKNQHPDVFILQARQEEKNGVVKTYEIGIDEIKALQHQISLSAYSAKYKVAIIEEANWLTREAVNAFLKTLEEPTGRALIILISSNWQTLLPTIISRCQLVKFLAVPEKEMFAALKLLCKRETDLEKAMKLSAGRPGRAAKLLKEPQLIIEQQRNIEDFKKILRADLASRFDLARDLSENVPVAQAALEQWTIFLRDKLLESVGCEQFTIFGGQSAPRQNFATRNLLNSLREIQKAQAILGNPSFNARLTLEVMLMKL